MSDHKKAAQKLFIKMTTSEWIDKKGVDNYKVKNNLSTSKRSHPIVISGR